MRQLRTEVLERTGGTQLLQQIEIVDLADIPPEPAVAAAFKRLRTLRPLGTQYEWLARLRRSRKLDGLELSIHVDDRAAAFRREESPADYDLVLGGFAFPLLTMTKLDIEREAREKGFIDLLEKTWFCHRGGNSPCGYCAPCRFTIKEGLGRRVPLSGRLRYYLIGPLRKPYRRVRSLVPSSWRGNR